MDFMKIIKKLIVLIILIAVGLLAYKMLAPESTVLVDGVTTPPVALATPAPVPVQPIIDPAEEAGEALEAIRESAVPPALAGIEPPPAAVVPAPVPDASIVPDPALVSVPAVQ